MTSVSSVESGWAKDGPAEQSFRVSMPTVRWENIEDQEIRAAYARVHQRLCETVAADRHADRCMTILCAFVQQYNAAPKQNHNPLNPITNRDTEPTVISMLDIRTLNATSTGTEAAHCAWEAMRKRHQWTTKYERKVQTLLGQALFAVVEPLAVVVNPVKRCTQDVVAVDAARSQLRRFELHMCLPMRLRRAGPRNAEVRILMHIANEWTDLLRSASKGNVQRILRFADRMISGAGVLSPAYHGNSFDEHWASLRRVTAMGWLERYDRLNAAAPEPDNDGRHIGFLPTPTPPRRGCVYGLQEGDADAESLARGNYGSTVQNPHSDAVRKKTEE